MGPRPVEWGDDRTPEGIRNLCSNVEEWTETLFEGPTGLRKEPRAYAVGASYAHAKPYFYVKGPRPLGERVESVGFRCALSLKDAQESQVLRVDEK